MKRWIAPLMVALVLGAVALAQDTKSNGNTTPPPDTAASTVPAQVVSKTTIGGGVEVWELSAGTTVSNPNLSPGYGYKWQGGAWVQKLGDVDRLKTLQQPDGAKSALRVARVTRLYIGPADPATGLRPVTPAISIGSWLPEQFVACEQESAEEFRGLCMARLVRADNSWITVQAPSDGKGGLADGSIQIEARWLACLGRGSMPAVYGPALENQ